MLKLDYTKIIVPLIRPKYNKASTGSYIYRDGKLYFQSGKNTVYIREHFCDTGTAPTRLVENTIRYKSENLSESLESGGGLCYNNAVNDVL